MELASSLALHALLLLVVACVQGFFIPGASSPRLALTAHNKAVIHSAALGVCAVAVLVEALLAGGAWLSLAGDCWASLQSPASHLPLAAQAAGRPCDPAEHDYAAPKTQRRQTTGRPLTSTVLVKLSAVLILAGGLVLLFGADWTRAFI